MPELPEVEIVVRGLNETVLGNTIDDVQLNAPPATITVGSSFDGCNFGEIVRGREIVAVKRRGKNILMSLSGDVTLWAHLKMTGHFYYHDSMPSVDKHDLVIFHLRPGNRQGEEVFLTFNDYRRFGRLRLFRDDELWSQKGLKELGPEPLEISVDAFVDRCQSTRRMVKAALLDQSFIAGVGNIYADESLHAARIHPKRITASLSSRKLRDLHSQIQRLLKLAIRKMGTSVDSYAGVYGQPGGFQKYLRIYGREGEPCLRCGQTVIRIKVGSRSSHLCPRCQRSR